MQRSFKYDRCNQELREVVNCFLADVEEILRDCLEEVEVSEVAILLSSIAPALTAVLSKWVPEIIYGLYFRRMSFNDIKRMLPISSRVLSDKLKALEEADIILRTVEESRPPRVYYKLTELGRKIAVSLIPFLMVAKEAQKAIPAKKL